MLKNNVFGTQEGQSPSAQKGKLPLLAPEIAISVRTKVRINVQIFRTFSIKEISSHKDS